MPSPQSADGQNQLDWLNYIVKELWPFIDAAVEKLLGEEILPAVEKDLPGMFHPLKATSFNLGQKTPQLGPLVVYNTGNEDDKGVEINLGVSICCETEIVLSAGSFSVGINALTVTGNICIVMRPLINKMPIVGGLQVYFLKPPKIDFDFAGVGNVVDFPILDTVIRNVINDTVMSLMVLPNLMYIPLTPDPKVDLDLTSLRSPMPKGMLCLTVRGCKNLHASDWSILGKPNSDPSAQEKRLIICLEIVSEHAISSCARPEESNNLR
jgi:Ca2+-dependent lipid-binding protein